MNQAPNMSSFDLSRTTSNRGKPPVTSQQPVATSGSGSSTSIAPTTTNTRARIPPETLILMLKLRVINVIGVDNLDIVPTSVLKGE
jgi:hypothetical protein